jgi:hypothetical protein
MRNPLFFVQCVAALAAMIVWPAIGHAQKTAKACEAEWRANKAAIQGSGKPKKNFIAECRAGTAQAAAPVAPPSPPAATQPSPSTAETARTEERPGRRAGRRTAAVAPTATNGFASEAEARAHCPGDTVVWANTRSKIYHFAGTRTYGKTRAGAYMCERDTVAAGIRSAKNERRPEQRRP